MIVQIEKVNSRIVIIHNIPKVFFSRIEGSTTFGNHLFPTWANTIYSATDLKIKFKAVYDKYKGITLKTNRDKVINAFKHTNQIQNLCNNNPQTLMIQLSDLPSSIQGEISRLFLYLYNTALNYKLFEEFVNDTAREFIDRFSVKNSLAICPFCGIESFINIEGQARLPLDHWLYKASFPMTSVNFNNLVPIGKDCNAKPAKGDKNVLLDRTLLNARVISYYPFSVNSGINTKFKFINEPTINEIIDDDWEFKFSPNDISEQMIFDSWVSIMNIDVRYQDYFRKNVFSLWQGDYLEFIKDVDNNLVHANSIAELKDNFKIWKSTFRLKGRPGSLLYRSFIDYLINNASDAYLTGLYQNLKRM